jgi:arginyl-tRNA synthetase
VLGSDHHGYIARVRAGLVAMGQPADCLDVRLMQFVTLYRGGEKVQMSTRSGEFITLRELRREVGNDAARFFYVMRGNEQHLDFDMQLATSKSNENPVYYIQYAHARIASMLRKAGDERVAAALHSSAEGLSLEPAERELVKKLLAFPAEVAEAADRRAPHRIAAYALELAQTFTAFYRDCRVVGAEPEALESFRIGLSVATKRTIARALDVLGVSAPDTM